MNGHLPLSFGDINAWRELTGAITRPEEIEAILAMDSAYLVAQADKRKREEAND